MEEYLKTNIKLEIQLILFLLDVCILSEMCWLREERGRNLDPCQIDNFVSSLLLSPCSHQSALIWLNVDWLASLSLPLSRPAMPSNPGTEIKDINTADWTIQRDDNLPLSIRARLVVQVWTSRGLGQGMNAYHCPVLCKPSVSSYRSRLTDCCPYWYMGLVLDTQLLCGPGLHLDMPPNASYLPSLQSKYFLFFSLTPATSCQSVYCRIKQFTGPSTQDSQPSLTSCYINVC